MKNLKILTLCFVVTICTTLKPLEVESNSTQPVATPIVTPSLIVKDIVSEPVQMKGAITKSKHVKPVDIGTPIGKKGFRFYSNKDSNDIIEHPTSGYLSLKLGYGKLGFFEKHIASKKFVSKLQGKLQRGEGSAKSIGEDVIKLEINIDEFDSPEFENKKTFGFKSYNDFFIRKLRQNPSWDGKSNADRWGPHHPVDVSEDVFVAPADSKCFVVPNLSLDIDTFFIKGTEFNLEKFLESKELAKEFASGTIIIFRLAPYDYHRFHFPFDCTLLNPEKLEAGKSLHSVNPLSYNAGRNPLITNKRHIIRTRFTQSETTDFVIVIVGAMMVGKIKYENNVFSGGMHKKGDPLGWFELGGSTVALVFKPGAIKVHEGLLKHSSENMETAVKMGEFFAEKISKTIQD